MDQKVLVTRKYIADLQKKAAAVEERGKAPHVASNNADPINCKEAVNPPEDDADSQDGETPEAELVNPLANGPPAFMSPGNGRIFYLGTSSNWSFTRRVLSLAHQHVHNETLPTESLIFEGTAYDLGWDGWRTDVAIEAPVIPNLDYALYLINTAKFRCGQLYHLFDESEFMKSLYSFYSDDRRTKTKNMWYIHFLLILAFGKTFVERKGRKGKPPGIIYFVKALQLLPEQHQLYTSPIVATEILCCIAIFYQALDYRSPAHNYVGQAMRMAMAYGMHTRMPVEHLEQHVVERCRKIWWTVYILDRHTTSIQGLPQSIDDRFVQTDLPSSVGSPERVTTLRMHLKLCQSVANISNTVYAIDGRLNRAFLLSTKAALSNMASHADELNEAFPLYLDGTDKGIARTSAYLHLFYQQCVIVATRPLLFCFLKIRLETPEVCVAFLSKSQNVRNLIHMCLESAQHSIRILQGLTSQCLLETFLTFDLESIFIATVVLLMGPAIDPGLVNDHPRWLEKAYAIFRELVDAGNEVAKFRWSELRQLEETMHHICQDQPQSSTSNTLPQHTRSAQQLLSSATSYIPALLEQGPCDDRTQTMIEEGPLSTECVFGPLLTSAEMTAMADSIELYDAEWVSNAMLNHDIW
ncbi:fungal-specific transcription factor domain-containing protein [Aspergillus granulosus]|uniref:Fungal-specific transcription factor domain-containing protein n=1 Tax=Aspergillus granulosus TaxID=176169 RepID=A0ABR4HTX4_9EURO